MTEKTISKSVIRLVKEDITLAEVDAFVFYAQEDLKLGSGVGNAIAMRGGASIQEELDKLGRLEVTDAVVTEAGKLKAKYIIHAVGPKFQEPDTENKLRKTTLNVLKQAEEKEIEKLALPAMGSGFYGVAPDLSAMVTLQVIRDHLQGETKLKEVIFCLPDGRDMKPFQTRLESLA